MRMSHLVLEPLVGDSRILQHAKNHQSIISQASSMPGPGCAWMSRWVFHGISHASPARVGLVVALPKARRRRSGAADLTDPIGRSKCLCASRKAQDADRSAPNSHFL